MSVIPHQSPHHICKSHQLFHLRHISYVVAHYLRQSSTSSPHHIRSTTSDTFDQRHHIRYITSATPHQLRQTSHIIAATLHKSHYYNYSHTTPTTSAHQVFNTTSDKFTLATSHLPHHTKLITLCTPATSIKYRNGKRLLYVRVYQGKFMILQEVQ